MKKHFLSSLLLLSTVFAFGQQKLTKIWESNEQLPVPESVLYVDQKSELYVSLIDGDGSAADGNGGVAILNMDGSLKNPTWITGLNAPKGMGLYKNHLYVADINEVVVIDVDKGKVIEKIKMPNAVFLNDVTVDEYGKVYISDTREGKIFVLNNNVPSLFMSEVPDVNGLRVIKGDLYAMAGKELWKIDEDTKKTVIAQGLALGGDGLEPTADGGFLVTCWGGLIYHITANGEVSLLLDVQGEINTADLGYNAKDRILYVPTFLKNSVVAYQLSE